MKLIVQNLVPNGPGFVKLSPEIDDDMWDAYNLIAAGDTVEALTVRKIGGCGTAERVRMTLEIEVQSVEYDKEGSRLRVRGKNQTRNEYVQIGQYHTLELELKRPFVLRKELWDWPVLDRIEQSCDETAANADLAVLLMQEGLAHLFLVGRSVTATRARVEAAIPRKHGHGSSAVAAYDTAIKLFFDRVLDAFLQHVDFGLVQCVVIASPGFTKDQFRDYMLLQATRRGDMRAITDNKARIVLARAPSGFPHSLNDVLAACSVLIKDTRAAMEVPALQEFYAMMTKDSDRACYGPKHVEVAHERLAIKTLLLTDTWFRNPDVDARKKYVDLAESVKKLRGKVRVFSSMNVSGDQLEQLTGIAAVLHYPLPELDDIEM